MGCHHRYVHVYVDRQKAPLISTKIPLFAMMQIEEFFYFLLDKSSPNPYYIFISYTHTPYGYITSSEERIDMKQCMDVDAIQLRLKKIEGQVRGIQKMVGDDKPCEDILVQIGAVKAALHKTGQVILEGHMHHCVADAIAEGHGDDAIDQLISALNKFSKTL